MPKDDHVYIGHMLDVDLLEAAVLSSESEAP